MSEKPNPSALQSSATKNSAPLSNGDIIGNIVNVEENTLIKPEGTRNCDETKNNKFSDRSSHKDDKAIFLKTDDEDHRQFTQTKQNHQNEQQSPTKSILSNSTFSNGATGQKKTGKKSVSFVPDDDVIKKFVDGEEILDKKNPFKNGSILNYPADSQDAAKKVIVRIRRSGEKKKATTTSVDETDFVSTEDVLRESKYVQTYIKNPDKFFTYDPTIVARIKLEELRDLKGKKPTRKVFSPQTQERLKELRSKYGSKSRQAQPTVVTPNSKIPTYKKVSKPNYPDLSDLKVRTGTELEESLFNPVEVTLNARKFDDRVKHLHLSSDDDLDEFEDPLTKSDSSDDLKPLPTESDNDSQVTVPEEKKSFTNTVTSKEFLEFLNKKGLTLTPKEKRLVNGSAPKPQERASAKQSTENSDLSSSDMDSGSVKKPKKPSVFLRLLPSSIFSSKRKTTPKESVPTPQSLYTSNSNDDFRTAGNIRRVVLERQSFHGVPNAPTISNGGNSVGHNNINSSSDLRTRIEGSQKTCIGGQTQNDTRSSSISSALTNAEDFGSGEISTVAGANTNAPPVRDSVIRTGSQNVEGRRRQPLIVDSNSIPKQVRTRVTSASGRLSAPTIVMRGEKERDDKPQNFQLRSVEVKDGVIKPRVLKASLPISGLKPLPAKSLDRGIPVLRRVTPERQSLIQKRVISAPQDCGQFGRSLSMDRQEILRRTQNSKLPSTQLKPLRNSTVSQKSFSTPKTSKENFLDNSGPKLTSTPNQEDSYKMNLLKSSKRQADDLKALLSASSKRKESANLEMGPNPKEWEWLTEMKEKTDRELFSRIARPQVAPKPQNLKPIPFRENFYERVPSEDQTPKPQIELRYSSPLYAQVIPDASFIRNSPQRNTIASVYRNRNFRVVDGQTLQPLVSNSIPIEANVQVTTTPQPARSQSVLDEMMIPQQPQQQAAYGNNNGIPVIMRRKDVGSLSREEILNRVKEFCRKSMNKTPTKLGSMNHLNKELNGKVSSDISPVSYASVEYRNQQQQRHIPKIVAPQVPQRIQSLRAAQQQASPQTPSSSPIYAHVIKRSSLQSNISDSNQLYNAPLSSGMNLRHLLPTTSGELGSQQRRTLIATTTSETDSVFLPSSPAGPQRYIIMDSEKVTPAHVMRLRERANSTGGRSDVRAQQHQLQKQIHPSSYGYIQVQQQQSQRQQQQQQHPLSLQGSPRISMDGRSTPLVLERIQQSSPVYINSAPGGVGWNLQGQPPRYMTAAMQQQQQRTVGGVADSGSIVYLQAKDQVYRPINANRFVPITGSPANAAVSGGSIRRLQQTRPNPYESESGSEAGEIQLILQNRRFLEEDWQNEKSGRNQSNEQASDDRRQRGQRREDPRRHTLGGDMLHQYGGGQGQPQQRAMDLEMGTRAQKSKKTLPVRGYTPVNQGPLFDEDPGIMSEVETASTGFRRGGKQRSSLPVVRTPSKTLERPLGLVFLQYRSETKRALLPNEITSIDTVRALFVRSFPRQLTMAYLEGPNVKIYIHDASKDMFYELEDVRSHLREIRDRSVLRLFESNEVAAPQVLPGGAGVPQPLPQQGGGHWDQDQSYFSEPEFDSEYQHQHIHKSKSGKPAPYYVGHTQTLPRGMYSDRNKASVGAPVKPLRSYGSRGSMGPPFSYPPDQLYSIPDGYTSSPERVSRSYEEPYYSQYGTRGTVTPIIDEEQRCDGSMPDDQYALYGMKVSGRIPRSANQLYDPTRPEDLHRIRVEHMERQLANLTGLVQKALIQNPQMSGPVSVLNSNYLGVPGQCRGLDDMDGHSSGSSTSIQEEKTHKTLNPHYIQANGTGDDLYIREKPPKLGKTSCHKSVSFEKSVSFSDDIQGVPKSHSPQHAADSKPPKPAIKSSTLPRTSSQERDRLKPPPPPKPLALATTHPNYRPDIALAPEVYNHLRGLQKKAKDLRMEVRTLRRLSQAQAVAVREDIKDAFMRIRATLLASSGSYWGQGDQERTRMSREEELYKQEVIRLEKDLSDLESSVEGLRGEVINRRTRVNMAAVEDMALVLSRASKTVAELKMRFPGLQNGLRNILANEMEKVVREEKFLKDEPDRLESALRRCKKLTGTLVTLKRLASVQEQRLPVPEPINEDPPRSAEISAANKPVPSPRLGTVTVGGGIPPENALDALLDELQTFAKPQNYQPGDARPDESTSDDSSQTLQNTITTQLSQSSLFPAGIDPNNPQFLHQQQPQQQLLANSSNGHHHHNIGSLRRLHSYPSGSDTDTSPPQPPRPVGKPPVPERNADLLSKVNSKRIPPPPPPRTSSRSPLASPTSPNIPHRLPSLCETDQLGNGGGFGGGGSSTSVSGQDPGSGNSSGNESGNDHVQRQLALEMRHQELLKKQKMLQEQYARLQQMSKNSIAMPPADILQLKKTGSESNLPQKMGLSMSITGSMKNLNTEAAAAAANVAEKNVKNLNHSAAAAAAAVGEIDSKIDTKIGSTSAAATTTNKVYETDIL